MSGLLIKDFKLMKGQRNFFILTIIVAVGMGVFTDDTTVIIGFMTFIGSMFTLSTISYDEFDNGNAFLFSLPVTRKGYTVEKYGFGLIIGGGFWLLSILIVLIVDLVRATSASTEDIIMIGIMILPVLLILLGIMLPFQLKYGGEKGRIAMMGVVGLLFVLGFAIIKGLQAVGIDFDPYAFLNELSTLSNMALAVGTIGFGLIVIGISYRVSLAIVSKKEF